MYLAGSASCPANYACSARCLSRTLLPGAASCVHSRWFAATAAQGISDKSAYYYLRVLSNTGYVTTAIAISIALVIIIAVLLVVAAADPREWATLALSVADLATDVLYAVFTPFSSKAAQAACIAFIFAPTIPFLVHDVFMVFALFGGDMGTGRKPPYPLVYITNQSWLHVSKRGWDWLSDFHGKWRKALADASSSFFRFTFHLLYFVPLSLAAAAFLCSVEAAAMMAGVVASAAVLAAGLLLALTKLLAMGDYHVRWRTAWAGPALQAEGAGGAAQNPSKQSGDNRKWMQVLILSHLFLETIPQLCIQGTNNAATQERREHHATGASGWIDVDRSNTGWSALAITSMAFSAAFALDTAWQAAACWRRHGCRRWRAWRFDDGLLATCATWAWSSILKHITCCCSRCRREPAAAPAAELELTGMASAPVVHIELGN
jgi:hypothetical protein